MALFAKKKKSNTRKKYMNKIIFENTSNKIQVNVSEKIALTQSAQLQPGHYLKQEAFHTSFFSHLLNSGCSP